MLGIFGVVVLVDALGGFNGDVGWFVTHRFVGTHDGAVAFAVGWFFNAVFDGEVTGHDYFFFLLSFLP